MLMMSHKMIVLRDSSLGCISGRQTPLCARWPVELPIALLFEIQTAVPPTVVVAKVYMGLFGSPTMWGALPPPYAFTLTSRVPGLAEHAHPIASHDFLYVDVRVAVMYQFRDEEWEVIYSIEIRDEVTY